MGSSKLAPQVHTTRAGLEGRSSTRASGVECSKIVSPSPPATDAYIVLVEPLLAILVAPATRAQVALAARWGPIRCSDRDVEFKRYVTLFAGGGGCILTGLLNFHSFLHFPERLSEFARIAQKRLGLLDHCAA